MAGCNCLIDTKTMENQESRSLNAGDKDERDFALRGAANRWKEKEYLQSAV